jgi:hypothetical protein
MPRITLLRGAFVAVGAGIELLVWLLTMRETAAYWTSDSAWVTWLVLEAAAAVLIGVVAAEWELVVGAVLAGWLLQAVHFAVVTLKDEDHNLWAVGVYVQVIFGAVAVGLALLARGLTRAVRRRLSG